MKKQKQTKQEQKPTIKSKKIQTQRTKKKKIKYLNLGHIHAVAAK